MHTLPNKYDEGSTVLFLYMYLLISHPVWLCDPVRGLLPSGSRLGSGQQPVWDPGWRVENHDAVLPHRPGKGPGYRGVAAHSAGHRHIGCGNKRNLVFAFSLRTVNRCEIECDNRITSWTSCLNRPWSSLSRQTWFHGWCTTGLSLCTHMETTPLTPWRATSTARCPCSTPMTSLRRAGRLETTTLAPAGEKNRPSCGEQICDWKENQGSVRFLIFTPTSCLLELVYKRERSISSSSVDCFSFHVNIHDTFLAGK